MRYVYAFLLSLLCSFSLNAQAIGVNFSGSFPTGDFGDVVHFGYSGGIYALAPFSGFTATLYGGYGFWDEKEGEANFTNFPIVLAGARKYIGKTFYGSFLAGIYPVKAEVDGAEKTETQGALYPGVGFVLPVSFLWVDVSGNYLWTQDFAQARFSAGILLEF